jgi:ribosomal protein S18 acetylase RimI-like enzyme
MIIEPLRPGESTAVLERALERLPDSERAARVQQCLQLLDDGMLNPHGIWVARDGTDIAGVQVCVPLAGAACLFWLPTGDPACADALVQAGIAWAGSIGCKIAQVMVAPVDRAFIDPLLRHGFRRITRMRQLVHSLDNLSEAPPTPWRCEPYRPALHVEFARALERTYEGTLDCPELNGKRTKEEILAGHRGQGKFHPDFWWLVHDGAEPVAVVLLVEMPDALTWELAYLGIVPSARRRGIARAMTIRALHAVRSQGAARLLLAVDERNSPALALYDSLGFVEIECNEVLLYFW